MAKKETEEKKVTKKVEKVKKAKAAPEPKEEKVVVEEELSLDNCLLTNAEITEALLLAKEYSETKNAKEVILKMSTSLKDKMVKDAKLSGATKKKDINAYILSFIITLQEQLASSGLEDDIDEMYKTMVENTNKDIYTTLNTDIHEFYTKVIPEEIEKCKDPKEKKALEALRDNCIKGYTLEPIMDMIDKTIAYETGESNVCESITKYKVCNILYNKKLLTKMVDNFDTKMNTNMIFKRSIKDAIKSICKNYLMDTKYPVWAVEVLSVYFMLYCEKNESPETNIIRYSFVSNSLITNVSSNSLFEAEKRKYVLDFLEKVVSLWGSSPSGPNTDNCRSRAFKKPKATTRKTKRK